MTIRPCTSPQEHGWLAMRKALWPNHSAEALLGEMERFCAEPQRYAQFIALSMDGEPQGFIELALRTDYVNATTSSPVAYLEGIFVVPSSRRQGIARALVVQAQDWAGSKGCSEFASDALLDNVSSQAMHRALGFEETQRVVFFKKPLGAG